MKEQTLSNKALSSGISFCSVMQELSRAVYLQKEILCKHTFQKVSGLSQTLIKLRPKRYLYPIHNPPPEPFTWRAELTCNDKDEKHHH